MTEYGRNTLIAFLFLTIILIAMEAAGIDGNALTLARYLVVVLLSVTAFIKRGSTHDQKVLFLGFPLIILGDFFLVLSHSLKGFPTDLVYLGFVPFTLAYMLIARIYLRGFRWSPLLIIPTMVYGVLLLVLGVALIPHMKVDQILLGTMLAVALTVMAWAGASAIFNGYYTRRTSLMMAISGLLMLICDYGVAFDLFYPNIWSIRNLLVINVVWLAYIPGWTVFALVVMERELHTNVYEY